MQAAILSTAMATIAKSGVSIAGHLRKTPDPPDPANAQRNASPTTDAEEPPAAPPHVQSSQQAHSPALAPMPTPTATSPAPAKVPNETSSHALPTPPVTSTTTSYQAASSSYTSTLSSTSSQNQLSHSYSQYAYPQGYPYPHSSNQNHQPYPYPYSATSNTQGATPYSPAVKPAQKSEEENSLPSYEVMLVQALAEYNDPDGTAPKLLFQWMAAHYPLQANFRPSASQALQKAFKRGRFEKSKDGKYRLNTAWEGGNTSKRTTRRPQSYAQATTNPSSSSHPTATTHTYPSYQWPYHHATQTLKSQSETPPPPASGPHHLPPPVEGLPVDGSEQDAESHRDAWEAAQSILQALNLTSLLKQPKAGEASSETRVDVDVGETATEVIHRPPDNVTTDANTITDKTTRISPLPNPKNASPFPPPIFAGDISIGAFASASTADKTKNGQNSPPMAALLPPAKGSAQAASRVEDAMSNVGANSDPDTAAPETTSSVSQDPASSRAALQGSLALLAAQLADIASGTDDEDDEGGDTGDANPGSVAGSETAWPSLTDAASSSTSASSALNLLDGYGLDIFGANGWAGLRGVGVDA
ncbi:hypothetical protein DFH11DRAFT_1599187 [Phellopilus nigrolimitatus]|nr:hypothetical protein DFH11DRAFT_1599187 [Phellopilus nigrolimitatus]